MTRDTIDLKAIRARFPALSIRDSGQDRIYFDNPAGTQVPESVAQRMSECLLSANANLGGPFRTSGLADAIADEAHRAMADFINAPSPDEIVFGQNMTSLTLALSRSMARVFRKGDEIVLTRMDHDANVNPWLLMARDCDLTVKWLPFNRDTFEFDLAALDELLTSRTRLVCVGGASNLLGTINDVKSISARARAAGAWTYVDGVQSAPHVPTDVQDLGCDFFVCSAYKFFGPHQGILWGRGEILRELPAYKVRPASDDIPGRFETGTLSHEGMAGTTAAVDYFAWIGREFAAGHRRRFEHFPGRRQDIHAALACLFDYEKRLSHHLVSGLQSLPGVTVQGISDPEAMERRVPTVSFTVAGTDPAVIAGALAKQNVFVWNGHNYAIEPARQLGLYDRGGVVRVGPVHYNSIAEIDTLLDTLDGMTEASRAMHRMSGP